MKVSAEPLAAPATITEKSWLAVYADLFKARLTVGTALVACGASALNQLWERQFDARMRRTQDRPLPSGRLLPSTALKVGCGCAMAGLAYLVLTVNVSTAAVAAASLSFYLFLYTPLKRVTWLNTAVGAIPGGLPPVIGWTAARGHVSSDGWALFAILALWQLPHFMAIAWIYRDEYARAGFKMLPVLDPLGHRTGRHAVIQTLMLLPTSLSPYWLKLAGPTYTAAALILGLLFIWCAIQFARQLTLTRARQLFHVSLLYLPLLLAVMVLDKIR